MVIAPKKPSEEMANTLSKTVCQRIKRGKIQNSNHLHNVEHLKQSTFQNAWITSKVQRYDSNFELPSK